MAKKLPSRPNLDQLKHQAKDLLKEYKAANAEALARIRQHLPRLAEASDVEMAAARFVLQDAQHVIACELDFVNWDSLTAVVTTPFESIGKLTDREIQMLLRMVDQKDLVAALIGSSDALNEKMLGNMSARVRTFIEEEMGFLGHLEQEEIDAAQLRIITYLAWLSDQGHITWPTAALLKKKAASAKRSRMPKQYLDAKEKAQQTAQKKLAELSFEEIDELFTTMAEIARREGILALEESGGKAADPFLQRAILLAVDGTQPELIKDMLDKWQASLLREQEVKYRKVIEGLRGIQAGDNPRIVEHKLAMIF
ncbi:MAG TPA: hypothetical protein EYG11_10585 [Candidatus Latescibacteria bacterium]|nr:hypothetical protein [Candidatus Handelsmanbacteria bacterium]HIL09138.1 hypothetical protein [Candidatus Latescibacterota bacterium]